MIAPGRRISDVRERLGRGAGLVGTAAAVACVGRMLEIEFVDRSVALAGKAFVSFLPLVIVVAAFAPEPIRSSIITTVTAPLGIRGDALTAVREVFASSDDVRKATGLFGPALATSSRPFYDGCSGCTCAPAATPASESRPIGGMVWLLTLPISAARWSAAPSTAGFRAARHRSPP